MIWTNLVEVHPSNGQKNHWLVSGSIPKVREGQLSSFRGGPRRERGLLICVAGGLRRENGSLGSVGMITAWRWDHMVTSRWFPRGHRITWQHGCGPWIGDWITGKRRGGPRWEMGSLGSVVKVPDRRCDHWVVSGWSPREYGITG